MSDIENLKKALDLDGFDMIPRTSSDDSLDIQQINNESYDSGLKEIDPLLQNIPVKSIHTVTEPIVDSAPHENILAVIEAATSNVIKEEPIPDLEEVPIPDLEDISKMEKKTEQDDEGGNKESSVDWNSADSGVEGISGVRWFFTHSDPRFSDFYKRKKIDVNDMFVDGEIPFDRYKKELKDSYVPIGEDIFDMRILQNLMDKIQQTRDRVLHINVHVAIQYFIWKRGIELLRGLLYRFKYEKPAQRQDGVVYEHLRDVELYFSKLEALHRTVEGITTNLDAAYNTISRKIAVAMPTRIVERYIKDSQDIVHDLRELKTGDEPVEKVVPKNKLESESKSDMMSYDALEKNVTSDKINSQTGTSVVGWE
jgi:hypothetical protein